MDRVPYKRLAVPLAMELLMQATPAQLQQASGLRYKLQGSTIAIISSYETESPTISISAATKANPCVITVPSGSVAKGDVFKIAGVAGMTELNGNTYIASAVSGGSVSLSNTDSSAYGTYTSGGYILRGVFSNFCELTGYDRTGATSPTISATTVCSTAEEYEVGLRGSGTTKLDYNFAPETTIQLSITDFDATKALMAVKILLPNSGGGRTQLGFVQQLSEKASVGTLWTASVTILNTGPYVDFTN